MRTYRLCEFVAHEGAVNCVRIGRSTAGVLATGGEDKKVNLWRTGQTEVVKSLSGLQSSVECVMFGEREDTIAAGGANGTVKVWDMESGKVSRSLTGHRSNCLSLAFTSTETNFLVSGSLDCNVKVWDLRRKEAIVTFKGHKAGVLKVATSPDNRWVCSGSEDGDIKLWDLQSGRMIKDGWRHSGRITGLEFNQVEFLLVSSGTDRTVRVWDLEAWEEVECLGPEATAVQSIAYAHDGSILLTATADAVKVWGLEPTVHHDTVPMDWRNLADLHMYEKDGQPRALGCCCSGNSVGVFMVSMHKVAPFCNVGQTAADPAGVLSNGAGGAQQRQLQQQGGSRSAAVLQDYPRLCQQQHATQHSDGGVDRDTVDRPQGILSLVSEAAGAGPPVLDAAGPLTRQLPRQRTPPRPAAPTGLFGSNSSSRQAGSASVQPSSVQRPGQLQPSPAAAAKQQAVAQQQQQQQQPKSSGYFPEVEIRVPAGRPGPAVCDQAAPAPKVASQPTSKARQQAAQVGAGPAAAAGGRLQPSSSRCTSGLDAEAASVAASQLVPGMAEVSLREQPGAARQQQQDDISRSSSRRTQEQGGGALSATLAAWLSEQQAPAPVAATAAASSETPSKSSSRSSSMPASRVPSRHDMERLPQTAAAGAAPAATAAGAASSADPIISAMAARPQLKLELARMSSALQVARGFASRGNLEGAYKAVVSQGDAAVACMLLEAVSSRADAFELGSLEPLIKLLELLLGSGVEAQVSVGLTVLGLVLRGPGQMVHEVCSAPKPVGVDLSFETRRSKCLLLKMALEGLGMKIGVLSRSQGPVGTRAQLLAEELRRIVAAGS